MARKRRMHFIIVPAIRHTVTGVGVLGGRILWGWERIFPWWYCSVYCRESNNKGLSLNHVVNSIYIDIILFDLQHPSRIKWTSQVSTLGSEIFRCQNWTLWMLGRGFEYRSGHGCKICQLFCVPLSGRACSTHTRQALGIHTFSVEYLKRRHHLGDLCVDVRIITKSILK
jgi:hypothetical protein